MTTDEVDEASEESFPASDPPAFTGLHAGDAVRPREFPSWDELYENDAIEKLPWYWPSLDPDLDAALVRHGVRTGCVLDLGTGPGTQAIALAERGFSVTATDVSKAALEYVEGKMRARGVTVTLVQDDVLTSRLAGPFDVIFDRGCFHVIAPERRGLYVDTVQRLLAPRGHLFLKTFSHLQPGTNGPHRFAPADLRACFPTDLFEIVDIVETVYQGQLVPQPKALFASIRRR